jgi:hypothetical protein
MPRTWRQSERRRLLAFQEQVIHYGAGTRMSPPRLRVTFPRWREFCQEHRVNPDEVFVDAEHWAEALYESKLLNISQEERLSTLWVRHRDRIRKRNDRARVISEEEEEPSEDEVNRLTESIKKGERVATDVGVLKKWWVDID